MSLIRINSALKNENPRHVHDKGDFQSLQLALIDSKGTMFCQKSNLGSVFQGKYAPIFSQSTVFEAMVSACTESGLINLSSIRSFNCGREPGNVVLVAIS